MSVFQRVRMPPLDGRPGGPSPDPLGPAELVVAGPPRRRTVREQSRSSSRSPNGHIIYAVAGLGIFGAFTIFDFNRLRRASGESAIAIAASIFLDILNVFLLLLELFGGSRE